MYTDGFIGEDIWLKTKSVRISHNLSDERLFHLSRIYLSLHELYTYTRRNDTVGRSTAILHRIERLFDECVTRCLNCDNFGRLAHFVPLLYRLARPCFVPVKDEWLDSCDTIAAHLADLWTKKGTCTWKEEHGAIKAVTELATFLEDTVKENDITYQKYQERLAEWNWTLSANHMWESISDTEALSRLEILQDNSDWMPDDIYDSLILNYKKAILQKGIPAETYLLLLDLGKDVYRQTDIDSSLRNRIQHTAEAAIQNRSVQEESYWFLLAVLAECCCARETKACLI